MCFLVYFNIFFFNGAWIKPVTLPIDKYSPSEYLANPTLNFILEKFKPIQKNNNIVIFYKLALYFLAI